MGGEKSAARTPLIEFFGPAVVPEHVKQSADGGLTVLGVDHGPSLTKFPEFVYLLDRNAAELLDRPAERLHQHLDAPHNLAVDSVRHGELGQ